MATALELDKIRSNPIKEGLNAFRDLFQSTCADLSIAPSSNAVQIVFSAAAVPATKNLVLDLILGLANEPAARILPSRIADRTLSRDLGMLYSRVDADQVNITSVIPLVEQIVGNGPGVPTWNDADIWRTVFEWVARTTQSTPPPRPLPNLDQTPWLQTTSSFANSSEQRKYVDDILKDGLGSSLYIGVPGFYDAFFGKIAGLEVAAATVFMKCQQGNDPLYNEERGWRDWPECAKEKDVLKWFAEKIETFLDFAEGVGSGPNVRRRPLAQPDQPLSGSTAERKLDVGFVSDPKASEDSKCHWSQILVPGELKSNPDLDRYSKTWRDLARYVREVLTAQDTRRFVLGFTLCGSTMRLWEFDRLGGIASSPFDINKDGLQFISAALGYLWMSEEQLGFDPTIIESEGKRYIDIVRHDKNERLILSELLKRAPCVAGRATTCWKAYREGDELKRPLVIKDSWQYPERDEEGERLQEAMEKGVVNVARYYHHETVYVGDEDDSICNNVRRRLDITEATNFRRGSMKPPNTGQSRSTSSSTAGRKRSSDHTQTLLPPSKRTYSSSPSKDRRNLADWDRVHRRVIVSDYGKPLYKASSLVSMLAAFEGNIKGHESLRKRTGIIQSDVSIGNLMMNEEKPNPSWPSFLIDLDLAIDEQREESSGARAKTGTRAFMAIGVLLGEKHSFMHDLESFFWVLFWICIHYSGPGEAVGQTEFECWNYEDTSKLARSKKGIVDDEGDFLKTAEESFTAYYKSLIPWVNRLRKVVFPDGGRWKKEDPSLYFRMKETLQEAQKELRVDISP